MNEHDSQPGTTPQPNSTSPAVPGANFTAPTVGTPQTPAAQTPPQSANAPQAMPHQAQPAGQSSAPYQGAPYGYGQQAAPAAAPQGAWSQPQGQPGQPYQQPPIPGQPYQQPPYQQPPIPGAPYQQPPQTSSKAFPLSVIGLVLGVFWLSIPGLICNCISQSNWSKEKTARGGVPVDGKTRVINIIGIIVNALGLLLQILIVVAIVFGIGYLASDTRLLYDLGIEELV